MPADGESASETAKNIAALLSNEHGDGEEDDGEKEADPESEEGNTEGDTAKQPVAETPQQKADRQRDESGKFVKGKKADKANDPELKAPAGLRPEYAKTFQNLPEGMKREYNRMSRDKEADYTRKMQGIAEIRQRAEPIISTAQNYIKAKNLQDEKGTAYTEHRLFSELLQAHENLSSDPDRFLAQMIRGMNASTENISAYLRGENPSGVDIHKIPEIRSLQNTVSTLQQRLDAREQSDRTARVAPISDQFSEVMREKDPASGELLRPELLDDDFLESTKPVMRTLERTNPGLSHGERLAKAHAILTGREYSTNNRPPPVPTRQNNQFQQRARAAAISVRGKIAPLGTGDNSQELSLDEIPNSPTETARLIYRRLSGG